LLHLRAAEHDTIASLEEHYLDLPAERMFGEPPPIEGMQIGRTWLDRALRTTTLSWKSSHSVLCPRYRLRHEGQYKRNLRAWARWIRPERARRQHCLVYVHGWLEPGSWVEEATLFRAWARELDVDLLHVSLPFHGRRQPRSSLFSGEFFWTADLVRFVEGVRQAVCDARAAVSWLRSQGYRTVGVTGISLGGAIDMLLACLAPIPDYIVPIVAHLRLEDAVENAPILWRVKQDLERWGIDETRRRELFRRLGWSSYEPRLAPERQLWVQAREDAYIGAHLVEEQWHAWSHPKILWIEGGHMTFPLHMVKITAGMKEFIAEVVSG
jgi:dienelactone hydrolase